MRGKEEERSSFKRNVTNLAGAGEKQLLRRRRVCACCESYPIKIDSSHTQSQGELVLPEKTRAFFEKISSRIFPCYVIHFCLVCLVCVCACVCECVSV